MTNAELTYGGWDYSLDPATYNLRTVSGAAYLTQKIKQRLQVFFGEWYLDRTIGIPYFETILGQNDPDIGATKAILISEIAKIPGVSYVESLTLTEVRASQRYDISFVAVANDGTPLSGTVEA